MRFFLIILSLLLTIQSPGQAIDKLKDLLKGKDFTLLKEFADDHPRSNTDISWQLQREIIPGYQEGVITITEYPLTGRDTDYTIHNYQIRLLSAGKSIFYYVFDTWYAKETGSNIWKSYDAVIDSFNNSEAYMDFRKAFLSAYGTVPDEKDLFITNIVYGSACGIVGTPTEYQ